jgi:hypothetical protein
MVIIFSSRRPHLVHVALMGYSDPDNYPRPAVVG